LNDPNAGSAVVQSIGLGKAGTLDEFFQWICGWADPQSGGPVDNPVFMGHGQSVHRSQINAYWGGSQNCLRELARWLCHFLSADERLQICNPPSNIALARESPNHPIHYLQRDDGLEVKLSAKFRKAFGLDLIVHRNAGSQVPLHVGERPSVMAGEDRVSRSYIERLELLPALQTQGDGMRSFAGVLLATSVGRETILLIDEPEAFLHPPQARLLGSTLVHDRGTHRQLFIATHSTDILRGVLEANSADVKVVRIRRRGSENFVRLLKSDRIRDLWSDPLLRYSNILDGLFHEGVIVCEADSDCRFYSGVLDATLEVSRPEAKKPDLMFAHCGGKARLPLVIRALREVDVPVRAIADFDVLSEEQLLRSIIEALGGDWLSYERDWQIVRASVDSKRPDLNTLDVKRESERILNSVTETVLPEKARSDLQSVLRRSTAWSQAKLVGKSFVPSGDPSAACERLIASLRIAGLHVVEVGELEGFARTASGHGPKWVNTVMARPLATDPELQAARQFVLTLIE